MRRAIASPSGAGDAGCESIRLPEAIGAMSEIVFNAEARERTGTGGARAARREGRVPGVVYGGEEDATPVSIAMSELKRGLSRGGLLSRVIEVKLNGRSHKALVREIQFHPVTSTPLHVDLYRVRADQIVSVEVPVRFVNGSASPGLKRGGALNIVRHTVELDCPADAIPSEITIDLTGLEINDAVHISAVTLPERVTPTIKDRDFTIATISGAGGREEAEEAEAEPGAEEAAAEAKEPGEEE